MLGTLPSQVSPGREHRPVDLGLQGRGTGRPTLPYTTSPGKENSYTRLLKETPTLRQVEFQERKMQTPYSPVLCLDARPAGTLGRGPCSWGGRGGDPGAVCVHGPGPAGARTPSPRTGQEEQTDTGMVLPHSVCTGPWGSAVLVSPSYVPARQRPLVTRLCRKCPGLAFLCPQLRAWVSSIRGEHLAQVSPA